MSALSSIEWTDRTWNPVRGCSVVSPGCVNCYAMKFAHRFSGLGKPYEGLTKQTKAGPQWTGKVRLVDEALTEPLRWKKPARVFVNSMSDLFHENVPDEFIDRVFAVMSLAQRHTFQVLTKRPERMRSYLGASSREGTVNGAIWSALGTRLGSRIRHGGRWRARWPLPNVWLGVSVEDQPNYDKRIGDLLRTPAAVRFLSCEPLLGPIDLRFGGSSLPDYSAHDPLPAVDWVIAGGESGPGARPCRVQWLRDVVRQCFAAKVPVFVKQLGANIEGDPKPQERRDPVTGARVLAVMQVIQVNHPKGGDPVEWPEDLRVREFPRITP